MLLTTERDAIRWNISLNLTSNQPPTDILQ